MSTVQNSVGKGEIACNEQYLLFHSVFNSFRELSTIFVKFEIVACNFIFCISLEESKSFEKGLKIQVTSLPKDKIFHWFKWEAFADDKLEMARSIKSFHVW